MVSLSKGSALSVGTTVTPTHDVHHLTGNGTIQNIAVPSPAFCGFVMFILDGASIVFGSSGNIQAFSVGVDQGQAYIFVYDPDTSKWYLNQ